MSVLVKRDTGFLGVMAKFNVLLNGEKIEILKANHSTEIDVEEETAMLQASQWGVKTNKLTVNKGERVEIKSTFLGKYGSFFVIFLFMMSDLFLVNWLGYVILLIYLISSYLIEGIFYRLEKVPFNKMS